jgi:hypothetical protein
MTLTFVEATTGQIPWYGAVMCCMGITCLVSRVDDYLRPKPKLSQWRGILAARFMFCFNAHLKDQTGNHLLGILEILTSSIPLGEYALL